MNRHYKPRNTGFTVCSFTHILSLKVLGGKDKYLYNIGVGKIILTMIIKPKTREKIDRFDYMNIFI